MTHYRERFLHDHMGAKIVGLAKRVSTANIYLTAAGERLSGSEVARLGKGEVVLSAEDTRAFLQQVAPFSGWNESPNFKAIEEFLDAPDIPPSTETQPVRIQRVSFAALEDSSVQSSSAAAVAVLERPVPVQRVTPQPLAKVEPARVPSAPREVERVPEDVSEQVPPDTASTSNQDEVAKVAPVQATATACPEVPATSVHKRVRRSPPSEHPDVKGLRLQSDGFYWNPAWDK